MTAETILALRTSAQRLSGSTFRKPEEAVAWLGAMQAQEYAMAKWAIGLRVPGLNEADVEKAFNAGKILRTHMLRPTWHFVTPADIRWMQQLTAPRVQAFNAYMYRKGGIDAKTFKRSNDTIAKALEGGKFLTRTELQAALAKKKIVVKGTELGYLMMYAELENLITSGPRQGKQFTYALLDERAPGGKTFPREEALARLAGRYFTSRAPATAHDFSWWSGLTVKDAKAGIDSLGKTFAVKKVDGKEYVVDTAAKPAKALPTFLLPDYDEYGIAYKDRGALRSKHIPDSPDMFSHWLVAGGKIEGTWTRAEKGKKLSVEIFPFGKLSKALGAEVKKAVRNYQAFFR